MSEILTVERQNALAGEPGALMCFRDLRGYRVYEGEVSLESGASNVAYIMMVPARQTRATNLALMHEEAEKINADRR